VTIKVASYVVEGQKAIHLLIEAADGVIVIIGIDVRLLAQRRDIADGICIRLLGEGLWGRALLRPRGPGSQCTGSMGSMGC
jgi:hypothetical protein